MPPAPPTPRARSPPTASSSLHQTTRPPEGGLVRAANCSLVDREHEQAVAALEVELGVAAATHRDMLLPVDGVRDRHRVRARAAVEAPEPLAGLRVERVEVAVALAEEIEAAGGDEPAADQRLLGVVLPGDLARVDVDGRHAAPLLLGRDHLERAAEIGR